MSRIALAIGLVVILTSSALAQTAPRPASPNGDLEQTWMELQRQEDNAEMNQDTATLDRILADNFFTVEGNGTVVNRANYIARFRSTAATNPDATYDYSDVTVNNYGDAAVVNYRVRFRYPAAVGQFRVTVVWVKQGDAWKTATFHYSALS